AGLKSCLPDYQTGSGPPYFWFCAGICNRPRFQRGLALSRPCSPPAPLLWECGNPRLMRVSKRRGMSSLDLCTVDPARHFHSELADSAHFGEKWPSGRPPEQKRHSPKGRVKCTLLQIVVQSRISYICVCRTRGRDNSYWRNQRTASDHTVQSG